MSDIVYLNGDFVPSAEAKISVFDHGFLYGDGLFETMRAYQGKIFLLDQHLDRLFESAKALNIDLPLSREVLTDGLSRLISFNGDNLHIRLTVSRGPGQVGIDPRLCSAPTIVMMCREVVVKQETYSQGVSAVFVKTLRNLAGATMPEVKSLNFLNNILAKQEVIKAGADEGIMLNHLGYVTEGTVSNVFFVKEGMLYTPQLNAGLLPGITRAQIMKVAEASGIQVQERLLTKLDFAEADEVFYTNSGAEVVPVSTLDGAPVGSGRPGAITLQLLERYRHRTGG